MVCVSQTFSLSCAVYAQPAESGEWDVTRELMPPTSVKLRTRRREDAQKKYFE